MENDREEMSHEEAGAAEDQLGRLFPNAGVTPALTLKPEESARVMAKVQQEMLRAHEQLSEERIMVSAGGDAVQVVIDGKQRLHQIVISPDALAQGDVALLQDLLVAAVNNAIEQSQTLAAERLQGLTGRLGLPDFLTGDE
jgi:DNA-binding protein YbaB